MDVSMTCVPHGWRDLAFLLGFAIGTGSMALGAETPTYCKDVAPILQKNCQECHRPGQVGPFSLETYDQARKRASDIAAVVEDRVMPPWKADPHVGVKFKDVRTLSDQEIVTVVAW